MPCRDRSHDACTRGKRTVAKGYGSEGGIRPTRAKDHVGSIAAISAGPRECRAYGGNAVVGLVHCLFPISPGRVLGSWHRQQTGEIIMRNNISNRRRLLGASFLAVAAGLLLAPVAARADSTLVISIAADPTGFDPEAVANNTSGFVMATVFDSLVSYKPGTTEVAPGLAKSWDISPDGLTYTFHLRTGHHIPRRHAVQRGGVHPDARSAAQERRSEHDLQHRPGARTTRTSPSARSRRTARSTTTPCSSS